MHENIANMNKPVDIEKKPDMKIKKLHFMNEKKGGYKSPMAADVQSLNLSTGYLGRASTLKSRQKSRNKSRTKDCPLDELKDDLETNKISSGKVISTTNDMKEDGEASNEMSIIIMTDRESKSAKKRYRMDTEEQELPK